MRRIALGVADQIPLPIICTDRAEAGGVVRRIIAARDAVPVLPVAKVPISLRVDADVLAFFRAPGPRHQSRMNAVLRSFMDRAARLAADKPKRRGSA